MSCEFFSLHLLQWSSRFGIWQLSNYTVTSISDCHWLWQIENPFVDGCLKKVPRSLWRLSSLNQEQLGSVTRHESVDIKIHTWWPQTDTGHNLGGCEQEGGSWSQQGMDEWSLVRTSHYRQTLKWQPWHFSGSKKCPAAFPHIHICSRKIKRLVRVTEMKWNINIFIGCK